MTLRFIASIPVIPLPNLLIVFLPVLAALLLFWYRSIPVSPSVIGLARMVLQLAMLGFVLHFLFQPELSILIGPALSVMILLSGWIALRVIPRRRRALMGPILVVIGVSGLSVLFVVTQLVLQVQPWYAADRVIPLAGMIFSGAMNSVSLALERYYQCIDEGHSIDVAQRQATQTAMIPIVNGLLSVGLVSIPGMMTGQVLAGESPMLAARYQLVVICMLFSVGGLVIVGSLSVCQWHDRRLTTRTDTDKDASG